MFRICMASDFFYPNTGGVEGHIYHLSQCLLLKGHKVIILTHSYGDKVGVKYITNGLKVYYLPITVFYNQCILPTIVCNIRLIRYIFIRENIQIVHGHSAFSALAHEAMIIGRLMGLKTVFTDHSLFGFADASAIITNKLLEITLSTCNHCICVSHIGKENTVLRAKVKSDHVSVIPNAVCARNFLPKPASRNPNCVTIVVVSRLVYRKGIDLLAQLIIEICDKHENIHFLIAGDGPKKWLLEEIREKKNLYRRVNLLGAVKHHKVRRVLTRGDIFLNTSLTEAFCMAIVEAAACGLQVVSTKVGGIPEVLPKQMIYLCEPCVESLVAGIERAVSDLGADRNLCPFQCNVEIQEMYDWDNVTTRTEKVYGYATKEPSAKLGDELKRYLRTGVWPFLLLISLCHLILRILSVIVPHDLIDTALDCNLSGKRIGEDSDDDDDDDMDDNDDDDDNGNSLRLF